MAKINNKAVSIYVYIGSGLRSKSMINQSAWMDCSMMVVIVLQRRLTTSCLIAVKSAIVKISRNVETSNYLVYALFKSMSTLGDE